MPQYKIFDSFRDKDRVSFPQQIPDNPLAFVEQIPSQGMNLVLDRTDIPNNQFRLIKNAFVRDDKIVSRPGSVLLTPDKPDSDRIIRLQPFRSFSGEIFLYRVTLEKIYKRDANWVEVTGSGLNSNLANGVRFLAFNDRLFFTNGVEPIQEIDYVNDTYADLGNAPTYNFICGFNERILGANLTGGSPNPIQLGWSGQLNFAEWSPITDFTAGSEPLLEGSEDYDDKISGLFAFPSQAVVLREQSVWRITKLPSASNPFQFTVAASGGLGCDLPNTAVAINNGIVYYNYFRDTVYVYITTSGQVAPIDGPIRQKIATLVDNVDKVFGFYDYQNKEYWLCVGHDTSTTVNVFVFSFISNAWTYHEYDNLSALAMVLTADLSLTYDSLTGLYSGLMGIYDDLGGQSIIQPLKVMGYADGEITVENQSTAQDRGSISIQRELESKSFDIPLQDLSVNKLIVTLIPHSVGSIQFLYSKNQGQSYSLYKTISFESQDVGKPKKVTCTKHLFADTYTWRLLSDNMLFSFLGYEVNAYGEGMTEGNKKG